MRILDSKLLEGEGYVGPPSKIIGGPAPAPLSPLLPMPRALDKREYLMIIFLIFHQNHMM